MSLKICFAVLVMCYPVLRLENLVSILKVQSPCFPSGMLPKWDGLSQWINWGYPVRAKSFNWRLVCSGDRVNNAIEFSFARYWSNFQSRANKKEIKSGLIPTYLEKLTSDSLWSVMPVFFNPRKKGRGFPPALKTQWKDLMSNTLIILLLANSNSV